MKNKTLLLITCAVAILTACGKKPDPTPTSPKPAGGTRTELSKDSIFYYAKEIYLWNSALPSYETFNPRQFNASSKDIDNYASEITALAKVAINPATGIGYEYYTTTFGQEDSKYSYILDIAQKNPAAYVPEKSAAVDIDGNGNDFGIKLGAYGIGSTADPNDFALFLTAIYKNSPADKAGLARSNRITKINGNTIGLNFNAEVNLINSATSAATITLEGVKYVNGVPGGAFNVTLTKASYKSNSLIASNVFTVGSKKIGYLAYARFAPLNDSRSVLDAVFADFKADGVKDLIIDLRYNGGGYINTAEYLINHIAPSSLQGKVMFSEHYNPLMQAGYATILKNQPYTDGNGKIVYNNGVALTLANVNYSVAGNTRNFEKNGLLNNVENVVFIVSGATASASELVINALKPYLNVKIIGTKTYGKPVGFFPITIENKYQIWFSLFQIKNAFNQGDYFDGMIPDVVDDYDDPFYDFGNAAENYTAKAINALGGGVIVSANKTMSIGGKSIAVRDLGPMKPLGKPGFIGMVETSHKIK